MVRKRRVKDWQKFISHHYHKLLTAVRNGYTYSKGVAVTQHEFNLVHNVYNNFLKELWTVLLNGGIVWICIIPFVGVTSVWFIPCYGLTLVFGLELLRDIVRCFK